MIRGVAAVTFFSCVLATAGEGSALAAGDGIDRKSVV